jgi:hypothetical protein
MKGALAAFCVLVVGCGPGGRDPVEGDPRDACVGIACALVDCAAQGKPATSISGTVFAPNQTLPLYSALVYIPILDPGPISEGVECSRCSGTIPGGAIASTISDEAGKFSLSGVPAGTDVPLIITIGKWRRKVTIPNVQACTDNPLPATITSLPKNRTEGDLPKIAIATGQCDKLECLLRELGVSDSEFTTSSGNGRIHLYRGNAEGQWVGPTEMANGEPLLDISTMWSSLTTMKQYDLALFSCECNEARLAPKEAMDNMKAYADAGGRVFLSHFQNTWIAGSEDPNDPGHAPAVWPEIAQCVGDRAGDQDNYIDQVDNPKGAAFAQWMVNVFGSSLPGLLAVKYPRVTCSNLDSTKAEQWIYSSEGEPTMFQFTTPNEVAEDARCGKVMFADMHVVGMASVNNTQPFPTNCTGSELSAQEKALAFMLFDMATCVGPVY